MAIGIGHQLVGLLGRGIETDRMIGAVIDRKRHLGVCAVYRRRRRIYQVTATVAPAPLEYVDEAFEVGLRITGGVIDRVANASLGSEMHHSGKSIVRKQRSDGRTIRQIGLHKVEPGLFTQDIQPRMFQRGIIVIVEIVQPDNMASFGQQLTRDMEANEACGPRNQYCLT